jgi:ribosomal-protein-alanine N-acetyltransferase
MGTPLGDLGLAKGKDSIVRHDVSADGCTGIRDSRSGDANRQLHVSLRWGLRRDLDAAMGIEDGCFDWAWDEATFIECLRQRNHIWHVAEHNERVVGYVIYAIEKTRIEVLNFAVHPRVWRRGVGTAMVAKLTGKLSSERRTHIAVNVRETNLDAQLFFKACGFECVGTLNAPWVDGPPDEAAYRFVYRLRNEVLRISE